MYTLITVVIVLAIVVYSLKINNEVESDSVIVEEPTVEPVAEPVVEPVKKKRKPRKKKFFGLI